MDRDGNDGDANGNSFSKTICSICFNDLKPLVEDLQSVHVCGHVFHELCLQKWFVKCPNPNKKSCPICKQACTNASVGRLYFQSIGEPDDCSSQKPRDHELNPEELRNEVNILECKVAAITSCLEQKQKEFVKVKDELNFCNDQLKAEVALKNEALVQTSTSQRLLRVKSEELDRSTLEYMRVKEKNLALAKELATYRLAYDMDLKEDEALKLASLGNDTGSREGNHLLLKSLDTHKRSYKELLAKCNDLGRREARHSEELEKANKKIKKLKLRVQELATTVEMKENEALRVLKDQKIKLKSPPEHQMKKPGLDESIDIPSFGSSKVELPEPMSEKSSMNAKSPCSYNVTVEEHHSPKPVSCFNGEHFVEMVNSDSEESMRRGIKRNRVNEFPSNAADEVICFGNTNPIQISLHTKKETDSSIPLSQTGSHCFSGGLLGPDGTNWHLGKWCKKAKNQGPNAISGDLITVGADGRGGQIKVLKSLHQSSLDVNDTSSWTQKFKQNAKPNKLRGKAILNIEHFFRKTGE